MQLDRLMIENNSTWEKFTSLFQLYASGTHALIDKRLEVVDVLLSSNDERTQACGIDALSSSLEGTHFRPPHELEFGARPRDYGWTPQNEDEVVGWYNSVIEYTKKLVFSDHPIKNKHFVSSLRNSGEFGVMHVLYLLLSQWLRQ